MPAATQLALPETQQPSAVGMRTATPGYWMSESPGSVMERTASFKRIGSCDRGVRGGWLSLVMAREGGARHPPTKLVLPCRQSQPCTSLHVRHTRRSRRGRGNRGGVLPDSARAQWHVYRCTDEQRLSKTEGEQRRCVHCLAVLACTSGIMAPSESPSCTDHVHLPVPTAP